MANEQISNEYITKLVDTAIDMCKKMANAEINPAEKESLQKLDTIIDQIKGLKKKNLVTEEVAKNIAAPFGVLAGEIMLHDKLQSEGFSWLAADINPNGSKELSLVISDKSGVNTIDTIAMVYKTLSEDSDTKSSLNQFYEGFILMLSML